MKKLYLLLIVLFFVGCGKYAKKKDLDNRFTILHHNIQINERKIKDYEERLTDVEDYLTTPDKK